VKQTCFDGNACWSNYFAKNTFRFALLASVLHTQMEDAGDFKSPEQVTNKVHLMDISIFTCLLANLLTYLLSDNVSSGQSQRPKQSSTYFSHAPSIDSVDTLSGNDSPCDVTR